MNFIIKENKINENFNINKHSSIVNIKMNRFLIISILALFSTIIFGADISENLNQTNYFEFESHQQPCGFFDTINITDGVLNSDNSITHNKINYSIFEYRDFDYVYTDIFTKVKVDIHTRGCVCMKKSCVRLCCNGGESYYNDECVFDLTFHPFEVTITQGEKSNIYDLYDENEKVVAVYGKPCTKFTLRSFSKLIYKDVRKTLTYTN